MLAPSRNATNRSEHQSMATFPTPRRVGANSTRWRLSDLLDFEATRDGQPAPKLEPDAERYLSAADVAHRYHVTASSVWRWSLEAKRAAEPERAA